MTGHQSTHKMSKSNVLHSILFKSNPFYSKLLSDVFAVRTIYVTVFASVLFYSVLSKARFVIF